MGKIIANRNEAKSVLAQKELTGSRVDNAVNQLEAFIDNENPTNAQVIAQIKLQARILRFILLFLRR